LFGKRSRWHNCPNRAARRQFQKAGARPVRSAPRGKMALALVPKRKGRGPHKIEKRGPFGPRSVLRDSKKRFRGYPSKQLVLRPACTVRTWHPTWLGIHPLLPAADGSSVPDQRSRKRLLTTPVETDFWTRPFTRQRRKLPCGVFRSRVVAPGLYLQNHPGSSASPVRFLAPGRVLAVMPLRGTIIAGNPLQSVPSRILRLSSGRCSPPGR
jgi:hypothetical protein